MLTIDLTVNDSLLSLVSFLMTSIMIEAYFSVSIGSLFVKILQIYDQFVLAPEVLVKNCKTLVKKTFGKSF
jgi:hypothetical protein